MPSGVRSRGPTPVPPDVMTSRAPPSQRGAQRPLDGLGAVGHHRHVGRPRSRRRAAGPTAAGPDRSLALAGSGPVATPTITAARRRRWASAPGQSTHAHRPATCDGRPATLDIAGYAGHTTSHAARTAAGELPQTRAGRRRSNPPRESLRPLYRHGEATLESGPTPHDEVPPTVQAGAPRQADRQNSQVARTRRADDRAGSPPTVPARPDDPAEQPVTDLSQLHDAVVNGVPAVHLDTRSDAVAVHQRRAHARRRGLRRPAHRPARRRDRAHALGRRLRLARRRSSTPPSPRASARTARSTCPPRAPRRRSSPRCARSRAATG